MNFAESIPNSPPHSCKTQNCYLLPDAQLTVHNFQPAISNEAKKESGSVSFSNRGNRFEGLMKMKSHQTNCVLDLCWIWDFKI